MNQSAELGFALSHYKQPTFALRRGLAGLNSMIVKCANMELADFAVANEFAVKRATGYLKVVYIVCFVQLTVADRDGGGAKDPLSSVPASYTARNHRLG